MTMILSHSIKLVRLTLPQLETGLRSIRDLAAELNTPLVENLFVGDALRAVTMKIDKMRKVPQQLHPWFTYWLIVILCENTGAGLVGFKGEPDANGEAEIGYGIDPFYQNRGYMTEAVREMVNWAFSHPQCLAITAKDVRLDNYPSQKVLVKTGFAETGSDEHGVSFRLAKNQSSFAEKY